jgi:hypothetical protein
VQNRDYRMGCLSNISPYYETYNEYINGIGLVLSKSSVACLISRMERSTRIHTILDFVQRNFIYIMKAIIKKLKRIKLVCIAFGQC